MAALFQRGRSRPAPASFASEALDSSDAESDVSEEDMVAAAPSSSSAMHDLEDRTAPAAARMEPMTADTAAAVPGAAPSKTSFLRRLGTLRRSVSPAKRGTAGQQKGEKSPKRPGPAADEATAKPTAAEVLADRQPTSGSADNSRDRELGRGADEGWQAQGAAKPARVQQHPHSHGSHPSAWNQGLDPNSGASRAPMHRQESAAARLSESRSHNAAAGPTAAVAAIARSGSNASSLATDTTVVSSSGTSLGLGNARTAADSYGGSVFASALTQEAGLQLLTQVRVKGRPR